MAGVHAVEALLESHHEGEGELADAHLERQVHFIADRNFPEGIGGVSALIDDHAVDHREEDHDLEVNFCHLFEVAVVEVQLVIYFFFFEDEFLDVSPTAEVLVGLAVGEAAGDEPVDAVVLVVVEGDLAPASEVFAQYGLREYASALLVEGVLEVDEFVDDDAQRPDVVFWVEVCKINHIVIDGVVRVHILEYLLHFALLYCLKFLAEGEVLHKHKDGMLSSVFFL